MILTPCGAFSKAAQRTIIFKLAIAALKIVCPGHGFSPADAESTVAAPYVIRRKGMQMDKICIVERTLIF